MSTCYVVSDLLPFLQLKKSDKHPWRSVTFRSNTPGWVFFTFFRLYKWYQIGQSISYLLYDMISYFFSYSLIILSVIRQKTNISYPLIRTWRSGTFSKVAGWSLKLTLLHGCFSRFLNCTSKCFLTFLPLLLYLSTITGIFT